MLPVLSGRTGGWPRPRGGSGPHGAHQRATGAAAPGRGHDIQIPKLPETAQPQGCRPGHGGGDSHQIPTGMGGKDSQHSRTRALGEPGQRLPRHHRLAVMVPVLVEHSGNVSQLSGGRLIQLGHHRNHAPRYSHAPLSQTSNATTRNCPARTPASRTPSGLMRLQRLLYVHCGMCVSSIEAAPGCTVTAVPYATTSDMMPPISLQSNRMATTALAPRARAWRHMR